MVSGMKSRRELRRKLHILRTLTRSKSVKKSEIVADTILHIYKLNLHLEKIRREISNFDANKREVKVEKDGDGFVVRVKCEENVLVGVLEVFEKMGLMVLNASVSTKFNFEMEAIVVPQQEGINSFGSLEGDVVAQAIVQAIKNYVASSDG